MTERKRVAAVVEIDRDEQVDELVRLASNAEIGLQIFGDQDVGHLDFVTVVDVAEREDGIYVFAHRADAERFASAVNEGAAGNEENRAFVMEDAVSLGPAAERLIAAERGDVIEDLGWPGVAEDVREGAPLTAVLAALSPLDEDGEAAAQIGGWIALDSEAPRQLLSDADALDQLAALLNGPEQWNGGDVCEELAVTLERTGRRIES